MTKNSKKGYTDKLFFKENIKSDIIRKMMQDSSLSQSDIADYLNCTISSLRNKFTRDSFSLYDFIIISYVCGYSLSICNGDLNESIVAAQECIDSVLSSLHDEGADLQDAIDEALDEAEIAEEHLSYYECIFDFSPENILTDDEFQRIQKMQIEKRKAKYNKVLNNMTEKEQMDLFDLLKERQENTQKDS